MTEQERREDWCRRSNGGTSVDYFKERKREWDSKFNSERDDEFWRQENILVGRDPNDPRIRGAYDCERSVPRPNPAAVPVLAFAIYLALAAFFCGWVAGKASPLARAETRGVG